jgi:hypothetical protein
MKQPFPATCRSTKTSSYKIASSHCLAFKPRTTPELKSNQEIAIGETGLKAQFAAQQS